MTVIESAPPTQAAAPKTGAGRAAAGGAPPGTGGPDLSASLTLVRREDPLAGMLARSVAERTALAGPGAPADGPVLQRLIDSKTFEKKTAVTMAVRGKTLEELDRLLAEYHRLVASGAYLKRGSPLNRLQQVLTDICDDTRFWIESHAGDTTARGKKRRAVIAELHSEALTELTEMRTVRRGRQEAAVESFVAKDNAFLLKMTGSASSILETLGTAIGLAIPKPGDSVSADLAVRIPCDSYGVSFVGFRLHAEASRMDGTTTNVRLEAAVIGGAQIAGLADITGELGFFLQAQGATPQQAMKLISWGWYRQFREARAIPREVANFMWGGSTTSVGFVRSEQWAANVEKEAFKRDYDRDTALSSGVGSKATTNEYVRFGLLTGIGAEVGGIAGDLVGVAAGASMNAGVHYDQTSVEQAKKGQDERRRADEGAGPLQPQAPGQRLRELQRGDLRNGRPVQRRDRHGAGAHGTRASRR